MIHKCVIHLGKSTKLFPIDFPNTENYFHLLLIYFWLFFFLQIFDKAKPPDVSTCHPNLWDHVMLGGSSVSPPHLDFCTHVGGVNLKRWTVQSERLFKVLTIWVNHCSLANEKLSFPATYVRWGWSGALRKCNKYDLTATQCFWLAHHNDWSRWFVISSPSPICCPSFSFIGGVAKEYGTKLGCEKYFLRVTYSAPLEML